MFPAGGWTVTRPLEEGASVYETTDSEWVIKRLSYNTDGAGPGETCEELEATLNIFNNRSRLRNCVAFPRSLREFCGVEQDGYAWIAIRRYSGAVSLVPGAPVGPVIWNRHWKRLAIQVLAFLEDYHTVCRRIHMDLKVSNILMDREHCQFVVTDFGLSVPPARTPLVEYSADYLWYYLEHGAEPEKPIAAWRFDLIALGYLLARLTWNPDMSDRFVEAAREMRRGSCTSYTAAGLVSLRSGEMGRGICPLLRTYFDMVESSIGWYDVEPPPRVFYRSLASLFE
jgi:hypothetical protein